LQIIRRLAGSSPSKRSRYESGQRKGCGPSGDRQDRGSPASMGGHRTPSQLRRRLLPQALAHRRRRRLLLHRLGRGDGDLGKTVGERIEGVRPAWEATTCHRSSAAVCSPGSSTSPSPPPAAASSRERGWGSGKDGGRCARFVRGTAGLRARKPYQYTLTSTRYFLCM
jgi:hypothetical protein